VVNDGTHRRDKPGGCVAFALEFLEPIDKLISYGNLEIQRLDIMLHYKLGLTALMAIGLFVGMGLTQNTKDAKEPKEKPVKITEPDTYKEDLKIVQQAGMKGDGPELLEYFRKRTLTQPNPKEISALVKQLGDDDFWTREKAFTSLVTLGASAMSGIKEGENNPDLEVKKRVADLKHRIDVNALPTLHAAAARILAKLKPAGAAEVLITYVPFVSEPFVVDEICRTLGAVAIQNGKVEPVLVKALTDAVAIKRGAAAEALVRAGAKEEFPAVKKLLKDTDVTVRHRVCIAMMPLQDRDVVPAMIELLGELSANDLWPIEEGLLRLAGEQAPNVGLGSDAASRKVCRDLWAKWLSDNEKTLDMTKLGQDNLYLGYTLIVQQNQRIGGDRKDPGEVFELDNKKNVRWKFHLKSYPVDAHMIGSSRVMVAEWQANKVTERDLKGEVKWEYDCGAPPFAVQRLPNGNTFVAMRGRLIEVDRNKTQVWSLQRPNQDLERARKLPNGEVIFITTQGNCVRMDPKTNNILKEFKINPVQMIFGSMEVLKNGNIVVTHFNTQRVTEYDRDGVQVGNPIALPRANSVTRLPNGNSLVTTYDQRQVYEYDTNNQEVWNFQGDGYLFVARRR
jgi:outer membrane protein assembly factor BamB